MMFPSSLPSASTTRATPPIVPPVSTAAADERSHVDYNLHPLVVASLDHYLDRPQDERFHIR